MKALYYVVPKVQIRGWMRRRAKWYSMCGNRKVSNTKHQRLVSSHVKIEGVPVSVLHLLPSSVFPFHFVLDPIHLPWNPLHAPIISNLRWRSFSNEVSAQPLYINKGN
jgi:hypothetical protein